MNHKLRKSRIEITYASTLTTEEWATEDSAYINAIFDAIARVTKQREEQRQLATRNFKVFTSIAQGGTKRPYAPRTNTKAEFEIITE